MFERICCVFPVGNGDFFVEEFGGQKVRVDIPESSFDELTDREFQPASLTNGAFATPKQ